MLGSKISDEPFFDIRAIYSLRVDFSLGSVNTSEGVFSTVLFYGRREKRGKSVKSYEKIGWPGTLISSGPEQILQSHAKLRKCPIFD